MDFVLIGVGLYVVLGAVTVFFILGKDFMGEARAAGAEFQRIQKTLEELRGQKDFPDKASMLSVEGQIRNLEGISQRLCVPRFHFEFDAALCLLTLWPVMWCIAIYNLQSEKIDKVFSWWGEKRTSLLQKVWLYLMGF